LLHPRSPFSEGPAALRTRGQRRGRCARTPAPDWSRERRGRTRSAYTPPSAARPKYSRHPGGIPVVAPSPRCERRGGAGASPEESYRGRLARR